MFFIFLDKSLDGDFDLCSWLFSFNESSLIYELYQAAQWFEFWSTFFSATRNFLRMQTFMKYAAQQLLSSEIQKVVDIFKNRVEISEHFNCLNIMQY